MIDMMVDEWNDILSGFFAAKFGDASKIPEYLSTKCSQQLDLMEKYFHKQGVGVIIFS